ncbi:MAG TPA: hypothetical protein VJW73_06850, partial [Gemmatimonadaceae bacterium]|nr:hypothetical protein [Gemmatimonadaceae bacterium]
TDCKGDWERAQLWIVKHSKWKIQTATDVLVETYNPSEYDPSFGFTATKEPLGNGRYKISLNAKCANFLGCDPREADVVAAFNHYVATGLDVLASINHGSAIH